MAAPTSVRVESNSLTTATVRWAYAGAAKIAVYRATAVGGPYAEITDAVTRVATGTLLYIDSGLEVQTKYWYKVSDDVGSTFSSVVTVWTQACLPPAGSLDTFSLPRLDPPNDARIAPDEDPNAHEILVVDTFNNLSERIENVLGGRLLNPDECIVCPSDGALILNCAGHCRQWTVIADEDINSISMQYCDEGDGNIDFVIPPNVTRRITGWPNGLGFWGDQPSIVSGSNGRTMSVPTSPTGGKAKPSSSKPGTGSGAGSGGGAGGSGGCNCTAVNGDLTLKSCNAGNSLDCTGAKKLFVIACGGRGPYDWTNTGNISMGASKGANNVILPPSNPGSAATDNAYAKQARNCQTCSGATCTAANSPISAIYDCGDRFVVCSSSFGCVCCGAASNSDMCCPGLVCGDPGDGHCPAFVQADGYRCVDDIRTAPVIAAGCQPCALSDGSTVTVTDALGTQVTIILRP